MVSLLQEIRLFKYRHPEIREMLKRDPELHVGRFPKSENFMFNLQVFPYRFKIIISYMEPGKGSPSVV